MKPNFFTKNILTTLLMTSLFALATGCGGGGGDSGGGPVAPPPVPRSEFITYTNVIPNHQAVDVDPQINEITVSFSEDIDPSSFITEGSALQKMINARINKPAADGTVISGIINQANQTVDLSRLTLEALKSCDCKAKGRVLEIVGNAAAVLTSDEKILQITGYQFVPEENTGLSKLKVFIGAGFEPLVFSSAELKASGYVNSNMFRVETNDNTSQVIQALGQVTVSGKTITFRPLTFLNWGVEYRIVVKRDTGDTPESQGIKELLPAGSILKVRTLAKDEIFTFKTKTLVAAAIVGTTPTGADSSPTASIRATTNFKVEPATLNSQTVILNRVIKTQNVPVTNPVTGQNEIPSTLQRVNATLSYDVVNSQIVITPVGDLRFRQEYEVTIVGGAAGVRGSQGVATNRGLPDAGYKWSFTTSDAKVVSSSVTSNVPTDANNQPAEFVIKLNFKPNPGTIAAGVKITDTTTGGSVVNFQPTVANDEIKLRPNQLLKYGHTYVITVTPDLKSLVLRGNEMQGEVDFVESLTTDYSASFVMEQPKLVSYVPSSTLPISETSSIIFSYNFDFPASLLNSVSVTQRTGNLAAVPVQVRLSNSRTLEIKPVSKFHFDTQVTVTVPSVSVDGVVVNGMTVIKDVVGSNTLVVASTTPSSGAIDVGLTSEISVTFSHMLALTPAQFTTRNTSSVIRVIPQSSSCGSEVNGRITQDTNRVYFLPSTALKSWCVYNLKISGNLVSVDGRKRPSETVQTFTTNGLKVQNVYVTYAYETLVDINDPIEIVFNYDMDYFQWSSSIELVNTSTNRAVSGSISVWNNKITFRPYSDLEYSSNYRLTVKSGSSGVEGDNGETLKADYPVTFSTQNFPLSVDNYGPVGTTRTDARYWIEFSRSVNTVGFPQVKGYWNQYGYSKALQFVTNDNLYTHSFKPTSVQTSTDYDVTFEWIFENGFNDDRTFKWSVKTAATMSAMSASQKAAVAFKGDRSFVATLKARPYSSISDQEYADNCAQVKGCVGKLLSVTEKDYRNFTVRGKTKVDLTKDINNRTVLR